ESRPSDTNHSRGRDHLVIGWIALTDQARYSAQASTHQVHNKVVPVRVSTVDVSLHGEQRIRVQRHQPPIGKPNLRTARGACQDHITTIYGSSPHEGAKSIATAKIDFPSRELHQARSSQSRQWPPCCY